MTLHELCEPMFQMICRINRSGRKNLSADYCQMRAEVMSLLADLRNKASASGLIDQFEKIERPLIFFIDSMISESQVNFARDWHADRMAYSLMPPERAGDDRFFELLDETLADTRPSAIDRLQVFYTCLGLGFTGGYFGQPERLRRKINEVHNRIRMTGAVGGDATPGADLRARVCPEAYEHVNTDNFVQPAGARLLGWTIAVLCLAALVLVLNVTLYQSRRNELKSAVNEIIQAGAPASTEAPTP